MHESATICNGVLFKSLPFLHIDLSLLILSLDVPLEYAERSELDSLGLSLALAYAEHVGNHRLWDLRIVPEHECPCLARKVVVKELSQRHLVESGHAPQRAVLSEHKLNY